MGTTDKNNNSSVRLGLMPPLSGLVELYGPEISRAGQIACDEINEKGGVLGKPLELVILDDGSLPETAVPAATRLIEEFKCSAIIGNLLSNSRIDVAYRVAEPHRVPYLNFSFYEGSIFSRYFFHFAALPNQQIDRMIPWMAKNFGSKMFFAGSNYEWPLGSIDAAKQALKRVHGEIVGEEYLPMGSSEIGDLLQKVSYSGADVFVPYFAGSDQVKLLNEFHRLGLKNRMAVVMGHYDEAMVGNLAPEVREGLYSSNTYFMGLDTRENQDYLSRLARFPGVNGIWPNGNGVLTNFGEGTYICVHAFAKAANQCGSLDPEDLVDTLETISIDGPQGKVVMDPLTHHALVNTYLSQCQRDGSFRIIEKFGRIEPVIPERYRPSGLPAGKRVSDYLSKVKASHSQIRRLPIGIIVLDHDRKITHITNNALWFWGYEKTGELIGKHISCLWDDETGFEQAIARIEPEMEWNGRLNARLSNDSTKPVDLSVESSSVDDGKKFSYTISCYIPELDEHLLSRLETTEQILRIADIAVIATDTDGEIVQANHGACRLFRYTPGQMTGLSIHQLVPPQYREMHHKHLESFATSDRTDIPMGRRGEISGYRMDGSVFPAEASLSKFDSPDGRILVVTLRDITERKIAEEQLVWKATHDPLTALPNRSLVRERVNNALRRSKRDGHGLSVLFIDLDGFKLINDTHGHDAGDLLLKEVSERLVNTVRPGDTVGRLGGDEFVVLCEQVDDPSVISVLAERINAILRAPLELNEQQIVVTASIGLAYGHGSTHSAEDMLRDADAAMYQAKDQGRDGWRVFNQTIHEQARQRLNIANGLRTAIDKQELTLLFQPIVNASSRRISSVESLLRWLPETGMIPPDEFIPVAEMTGSIIPIGEWVFRQACIMEHEWREELGIENAPTISVNLSTRQLDSEQLITSFQSILGETGADPQRITLEITETALMSDVDSNLRLLNQLAELGLKVAVDDFGTGYSSLSQLLRLPVDILKVDRVFIDEIDSKPDNQTIVSAVISMSHALGLKVIAEGVETGQELDILKHMNCDAIQGYFFYQPMKPDALLELARHDGLAS